MAHTVDDQHFRAGDRLLDVLRAGKIDQRIVTAMDNQCRRRDVAKTRGAAIAGCDARQKMSAVPGGIEGPVVEAARAVAQDLFVARKARTADQMRGRDRLIHRAFPRAGRVARAGKPFGDLALWTRQATTAGGGHDRDHGRDFVRVPDGERLGDRAAVGTADDMCFVDAKRVEQPGGIVRHILQRVGRFDLLFRACLFEGRLDVRRPPIVMFRGQADIAVVVCDHPKTAGGQRGDEDFRPADDLHPETADQQQWRAVFRARQFVLQFDPVGCGLWHDVSFDVRVSIQAQ